MRRPRAGVISHVDRFLDRRRALDRAALWGSIAWSRPYPLYVKVGIAFRASLSRLRSSSSARGSVISFHPLPRNGGAGRGSGRVAPQVVAASSVLLGPSRLRYSITVFASPGSSRCGTWVNFQRPLFLTGGSKTQTTSNWSFGHLAGIVAFGSWLATR